MQQSALRTSISTLDRLRRQRSVRNSVTFGLIILGPMLILATLLFFGAFGVKNNPEMLRLTILFDLIYVLLIAALVSRQVVRIIAARRRQSAGSRLHLRLTAVFTVVALVPTVLVAIFAAITLNFGLEGWFSERVRQVVNNSLIAAQAYESEHLENIETDSKRLAAYLNAQKRRAPTLTTGELLIYLNRGQVGMQRALSEAYVIDLSGDLVARGERSYLFDYERPTQDQIDAAASGDPVIIEDWSNSEFRALIGLTAYANRLLYVTRDVDGEILALLDETQETVALYNQLEHDRGRLLFEFALIYLGFALIVILAAVWFGMWFAERLSRPVGRLAGAVARVGGGDLSARVIEEEGDDEIAILGRAFNRMTNQVRAQHDALLEVNADTERSRRLFDSVLSGVTAGVIGLSSGGKIEFVNAAAEQKLGLQAYNALGQNLKTAIPEFTRLFERLSNRTSNEAQGAIEVVRAGVHENLHVRIASRKSADGNVEGYVIAFDDVTDLVSAQRMAAWGDVARRIAHEIKNPLTPIQLSAERLRRKFAPLVGDEREALEQYSDVIIRQTGDIRRIVDEFAKFARMPAAVKINADLTEILSGVVLLQNDAASDIVVTLDAPDTPIMASIDPTLMGQAFTNLIKNAREAIVSKRESANVGGVVKVILTEESNITIRIQDNGIGLPEKRSRLFEPYVTTRDQGTGLGLPIVKKIVEDHDGQLELLDAPVFDNCDHHGAEIKMTLPILNSKEAE